METIGTIVSRIRNTIKAVKEDAFITDRYLYSLVLKYGKTLIRRQDNENKIKSIRSLFKVLPCYDLIEVDKVEACCIGIKSNCKIMRTRLKLPKIIDGSYGPLIKGVSTIDNSIYLYPTTPKAFISIANSPNYKYNKNKYYWYSESHIYLPNAMYEGVNVEAMWEDNIAYLQCNDKDTEGCITMQESECAIPDYLYSEIENMILQEMGYIMKVPNDVVDDKQSNIRP